MGALLGAAGAIGLEHILRFVRAKITLERSKPLRDDVPSDAPEHCPGVKSVDAGRSSACDGCPNQGSCSSQPSQQATEGNSATTDVKNSLASVKHKIIVMSGKGGVGKSTVATQLAWRLKDRGYYVGLLDVDICGPSIPRMTGLLNGEVFRSGDGWSPVYVTENFAVMSVGFLLPNEDDPIIWRGPKKSGLIRQFLTDVTWNDVDFLVIDTPPGTSDEHISVVTYLSEADVDGVVIVTTPQEVSLQDVRKEINFCKKSSLPIIGVVENMADSVFEATPGLAKDCCEKMEVPYIGKLSMCRELMLAGEVGKPVADIFDDSSKERKPAIMDEVDNMVNFILKRIDLQRKSAVM